MTTPNTDLVEKIARAAYRHDEAEMMPSPRNWEDEHGERRGEYLDLAAAVLPIVTAAQAEAFDAGWIERAGRETHNRFSPVPCPPPPARLNPYLETGDTDEH